MSWLSSFFIALVSGVTGLVCSGLIATICIEWFRISSREGASSYYMVGIALLGGIVAFFIGLVIARNVAAGVSPSMLRGLGIACGSVIGISLVALLVCWLIADIAPKMNGQALQLAVEVRCPKGFEIPTQLDEFGARAGVYLLNGRDLPPALINLDEAKLIDGQWVVPVAVPLTTSATQKFLNVRFSKDYSMLFGLPLRAHPNKSDTIWSKWVEAGWDPSKPEPPKEAKFNMRYRVQNVPPPLPYTDAATERAQEFAALRPDATLAELLPFLFEVPTPESTARVTTAIGERQVELAELVRSADPKMREYAIRAAVYPAAPAPELVEAVLAEGRAIADGIRTFNGMKEDDPTYHELLGDLRARFYYWKQTWWTIHQLIGVDGRPPMKEIHDLALVHGNGAMSNIEMDSRAFIEEQDKSAATRTP